MAFRKIVFSPHALERMKERSIKRDFVVKAIENPDKLERSSFKPSRLLIKKIYFNQTLQKDHLLMVIIELRPNLINVITIIDTSKISKYF